MREEYVEAVLAVVELVPEACVVAYGDVAELLGSGGPRQVGAVMSHYGGQVAWWRVLRASGAPPESLEARALDHYLAEGTPLRGEPGRGVWRVDLVRARWAPTDEELDAVEEVADLLESRLHGPDRLRREMSDPDDGIDP